MYCAQSKHTYYLRAYYCPNNAAALGGGIGGAIGGVVFLIIVGIIIYCCIKKARERDAQLKRVEDSQT
jgi:uncharacterized membrane protein